jgi:hypothetical protein
VSKRPWLVLAVVAQVGALVPTAAVAEGFQVFSGSNFNGPQWHRPEEDGPAIDPDLTRYHVQRFRLLNGSTCIVYSAQDYDGYLHLYQGSFNPASPLTNLVDGDDDASGTNTFGSALAIGTSRLPSSDAAPQTTGLALAAGTYFLVSSSFTPGVTGSFQNFVACNGTVQPLQGACNISYVGIPDDQEICLQNNRFLVAINNISNSGTGLGTPVRTGSTDTGLFWFYNDRNWEVMVKVLNGCAINNRWWVFAGALTNQRYTINVADANTLQVNGYTNPLGVRAAAIADTNAFPCP